MTALAAAIGASPSSSSDTGPAHDSEALMAFAKDAKGTDENRCTIRLYDCAVTAAKSVAKFAGWVWKRVGSWGHFALDLPSLTAFAPPPLMFVGVSAAAANASWYAVEGDYLMAGISLAAVIPALKPVREVASKASRSVKTTVTAARGKAAARALEFTAERNDKISRVATVWLKGSKATDEDLAMAGARKVRRAPKARNAKERGLQDDIADTIDGAEKEKKFETGCTTTCKGARNVDIYDPKKGICIEVKVSKNNLAHALMEVEKDLRLLKNKSCKKVLWIFGPGPEGPLVPWPELRIKLQQARIPYEIWR